jgi:NAD+ kinase
MRVALFENTEKPESAKCAASAAAKLLSLGAEVCATPHLIEQMNESFRDRIRSLAIADFDKYADILISFGGDGTMLSAANRLINSEIPIMAVNVGKLGFLAEFSVDDLNNSLESIIRGNYRVVDRTVLETQIDNMTLYAVNDFVIEKSTSRMITLEAYANSHLIGDYRADGLIVTTPTGSTAYSLSNGGPIITPSANVICLTPICPHSLTLRPLIIPDTIEIKLQVVDCFAEPTLVADGQTSISIKPDTQIIIKRSSALLKLIKPIESSYYELLRKKLLWGVNAENQRKM